MSIQKKKIRKGKMFVLCLVTHAGIFLPSILIVPLCTMQPPVVRLLPPRHVPGRPTKLKAAHVGHVKNLAPRANQADRNRFRPVSLVPVPVRLLMHLDPHAPAVPVFPCLVSPSYPFSSKTPHSKECSVKSCVSNLPLPAVSLLLLVRSFFYKLVGRFYFFLNLKGKCAADRLMLFLLRDERRDYVVERCCSNFVASCIYIAALENSSYDFVAHSFHHP
ncbi:hypothetical protein B0T20DRAFT_109826 [Sordaria brevicollis]|uniref:Uncharacterized protein n=1 Tax=Sordaria brevicollis TaxID=83679 RepID=A0AAE0NUS3_SORBR|nr:hypothetical protein B0T20DRAFT_109826 [Sordaria brevicollis]